MTNVFYLDDFREQKRCLENDEKQTLICLLDTLEDDKNTSHFIHKIELYDDLVDLIIEQMKEWKASGAVSKEVLDETALMSRHLWWLWDND